MNNRKKSLKGAKVVNYNFLGSRQRDSAGSQWRTVNSASNSTKRGKSARIRIIN